MESEGPRVPRGRRETAAEQMSRQQQEFEERGGSPRDEAQHAAAHNETHPKLKRPLDKRRSATEFLDRPAKRMRLSPPDPSRDSKHYRKLIPRSRADRLRRPRNINRAGKRRGKRPCTCSKCLKKPICRKNMAKFCVYVANKRIGTDSLSVDAKGPVALLTPTVRSIQGSNHSVGTHTPVSRNQSMSSYNSFYSSEHQPMV